MILVDVGVWLAAIWGRHAHHPVAAGWFNRQTDDMVFCRVTQMSLLRLLSNPAIGARRQKPQALDGRLPWDVSANKFDFSGSAGSPL